MRRLIVTATIRLLLKIVVRVRAPGIDRVPRSGPLIIAVNHINFLEVPLIYTLLRPRRVIGIAKAETWENRLLRLIADEWEAIPIHRAAADTAAFRRAEEELRRGAIVVIAPEGSRSGDGILRRGHAGVVTLAAKTGAPVLPMAHFGGEQVWACWRRVRRPVVTVRVGSPIWIRSGVVRTTGPSCERGRMPSRTERERLLRHVMAGIARLLPERYRGEYGPAVEAGSGGPGLRTP